MACAMTPPSREKEEAYEDQGCEIEKGTELPDRGRDLTSRNTAKFLSGLPLARLSHGRGGAAAAGAGAARRRVRHEGCAWSRSFDPGDGFRVGDKSGFPMDTRQVRILRTGRPYGAGNYRAEFQREQYDGTKRLHYKGREVSSFSEGRLRYPFGCAPEQLFPRRTYPVEILALWLWGFRHAPAPYSITCIRRRTRPILITAAVP
jgi:hypothetical protein